MKNYLDLDFVELKIKELAEKFGVKINLMKSPEFIVIKATNNEEFNNFLEEIFFEKKESLSENEKTSISYQLTIEKINQYLNQIEKNK